MARRTLNDLYGHTRQRMLLRYQHTLSRGEYNELCFRLLRRRGELICVQSNTRQVWCVTTSWCAALYLVYNPKVRAICTVLEPYMAEQSRREYAAQVA